MSYRDNREALEEKVAELTRELAAAQERHQREAQVLSELSANLQAVTAAVTHESPNAAPPTAVVAKGGGKPAVFLLLVTGALLASGIVAALFLFRSAAPPPTLRASSVVVPPAPPALTPVDPLSVTGAIAAGRPGALVGLVTDGPGFLVAASATTLTKVDARTLATVWSVPLKTEMGWAEHEIYALNTGTRLAIVTSKGAFFHDDTSGVPSAKFLWRSETMPRGACAPGNDQVLASMPFDGIVRIDATTGRKADVGGSCSPTRADVRCGPESECGRRTHKTSELECSLYLTVAKDTIMPCEADDGTRRRMLIALGPDKKERWRVLRAADAFTVDYMDVVADVVIIADTKMVDGYARSNGEHLWSHERQGQKATILGGLTHVVFGFDDTLIAVGAADGKETARLHAAQ